MKILIVFLLAKITEKVYQHVEKIKLTDVIKKRNFKSSKKSKNENTNDNKNKSENNNDDKINVDITDNKKIKLEEKKSKLEEKKSKNENDNNCKINVDITNNKKIKLDEKKNESDNNNKINVDTIDNNKIKLDDKKCKLSTTKNEIETDIKIETNNNEERNCIRKPNFTNIIKGVFELMDEIVNGKLTVKSYSNVAQQYIKYNKIDQSINNKRTCKTPLA